MAPRDYSANALIPHGHHQNWKLIEEIIREMERVTDQWADAETSITVQGKRDLYSSQSSLLDVKIELGDDQRDVTEVDISRIDQDDEGGNRFLSVTLSKSERKTSWVYASGPVKRTCEELVRGLQAFTLQAINHPELARLNSNENGGNASQLQHLHPAIKPSALARLENGHGDEAVEEACKSVGARLRQLSGLDDDGASLVSHALGSRRLVAINDGSTRSEVSEQEGYMHLGLALYKAARNPRAHRPSDPNFDTNEVIEWLSVASALHRALDKAKINRDGT
ncbi:TIGR02391 family protein [Streptomyces albus]|uniref:TIGR02391 family protein n=1 Tax=Streptomyces albus TaxID=1888 RepID=UPI0024AD9F4E|nr:TIGR02391 family protein [Streptomyces albus]MDI6410926.1 TIGR02391 family protein [Streptomyces albus]